MSTEKSDAIVIRQTDFSESSRVVTLFTEDFGKISALAKGAKRLKGPFEGAIDLLSTCRIVFIHRSSASLDLLTEARLTERFRPAAGCLDSLYGGYYVAELLALLSEEGDPHPVLYREALRTLALLSEDTDPGPALARFELGILQQTGHLPAFDACVACGLETSTAGPWAFWVSQGGVLCPACQKPEYHSPVIQTGTLRVLNALTADDDRLSERISVSPDQCEQLRVLTTSAIIHLLGYRPRTLRYVEPR